MLSRLLLFLVLLSACEKYEECRVLRDITHPDTVWVAEEVWGDTTFSAQITFGKFKSGFYESYLSYDNKTFGEHTEFGCIGIERDSLYLYQEPCHDKSIKSYVGSDVSFNCSGLSVTIDRHKIRFKVQ